MEKMTIKEFKDQSNIEVIQELMKINKGYITSKQLTELGIHRMYLNIMVSRGVIEKVDNGIYIDIKKIPDSYYILNLNLPSIIYSHMTALYFHGLSIKAPNDKYDVTVKKSYNSIKLKTHEVFYVFDDVYEIGLTEVKTPFGNYVRAYNVERCICDIIRSKNRMDSEHVKFSIKEYFKRKDKDINKLINYAEKLGVKREVNNLVEMFYE